MSKSFWKPIFIHKDWFAQQSNIKKEITIKNRSTIITPKMLGYSFNIYNGMKYYTILVTRDKLYHKLGEFAPTRKLSIFKKLKAKNKKTK